MNRASFTTRRTVTALAAVAVLGTGVISAVGTPASAAGLLASSTSFAGALTADGQDIAVSGQVKVLNLNLGLGLTPTGTVTFSDNHGNVLGGLTLAKCALKACTFSSSIPVSALADDTNRIYASYSGDTLAKPSVGAIQVIREICPDEDNDCGSLQADDGVQTVSLEVPSGNSATLTLGGDQLPCSLGVAQVINTFGSGPNTGPKSVEIVYNSGTAAATAYADAAANTAYADSPPSHSAYLCAIEPHPWIGFSPDGSSTTFNHTITDFGYFGPVPQISGGPYSGQYVGLMADCYTSDGINDVGDGTDNPCVNGAYVNPDQGNAFFINIAVPSGDPHMGG